MSRSVKIILALALFLLLAANAAVIILQNRKIMELADIPELTMKLRICWRLLAVSFPHPEASE